MYIYETEFEERDLSCKKNWKLRYWCHVIALLLSIRMVVRSWPYRVPLQSYERLNFTVAEGSAINHFEETTYEHYFLFCAIFRNLHAVRKLHGDDVVDSIINSYRASS